MIKGYEIETDRSLPNQTMRTSMYIRSGLKYRRRHELEQTKSHIITITLEDTGIGITALYQTYKLTHKLYHNHALKEQISILTNFMLVTHAV